MNTISFATGSLGNVPLLEKILQQSLTEIDPKIVLSYADPLGLPQLRAQIARLYSPELTEENVMITSSAQQALGIIFDYLLHGVEKDIFVQEPTYFGTLRILRKYQSVKIIPFQNIETIENEIKKSLNGIIYITSNFNSSGKSLSQEEKNTLVKIAEETGLIIIEDNPHDFLYFDKRKPSNIFELMPQHTTYVSGFSKILAPGIRVGYIITEKKMIKELKSEKMDQDIFTSTLGQQICINALKHREYLEELRIYAKEMRDKALIYLEETFGAEKGFIWNIPDGGIFISGQFANYINGNEVIRIARENYDLLLEDDRFTYSNGKSRNTTRINFIQNSDDALKEGIARLYQAFKEVRK